MCFVVREQFRREEGVEKSMRSKNPRLMNAIVDYVDQYVRRFRKSPSTKDISEHVALGRTAVYNYLVAMNNEGRIEYDGDTILTPKTRGILTGKVPVGVIGNVPCGQPSESDLVYDEYIELPEEFIGDGDVFGLYANGDSMIGAGILTGDLVVIRRQDTANAGDIVVAWVEGIGNTLKRYQRDGDDIVLHPENPDMEDIRVKEAECRIQGVAITVIRKLG